MKTRLSLVSLCVVFGLAFEAAWAAPVGTAFTYQGQIKDEGIPVNTTIAGIKFTLWTADSGGIPVAGPLTLYPVEVVNGLFTVEVDFGPDTFGPDARWVAIAVSLDNGPYVNLSPRQAVTPAPIALYALDSAGGGGTGLWSENGSDIYFNTGNVGIGVTGPTMPLSIQGNDSTVIYVGNTSGGASGAGITTETSATGAAGLIARNNSATGNTQGVAAFVYSPTGQAVRGQNSGTSGDALGIYGLSTSPDGIAIYGYANNATGAGTTIGVKGKIRNSSGSAVYGEATAAAAAGHRGR